MTGGDSSEQRRFGDWLDHDERYDRTTEYTQIVLDLLRGEAPVTREGSYYDVTGLRLTPPLPPERCSPNAEPHRHVTQSDHRSGAPDEPFDRPV